MASLKQKAVAGMVGLFMVAGNAMAQTQPAATPASGAQPGGFSVEGFKADVAQRIKAEEARLAKTPIRQQQAEQGAQVCGGTVDQMLKFREAAIQFQLYDKATDKVYMSMMDGGKRVIREITEKQFGELAMHLSANPATKGKPSCPTDFWSAMAIVDATAAFSGPGK